MKLLKNKFLFKLIASICLFLTLLNFSGPTKVYAGETQYGKLLVPIVQLLTTLADGIMDILHETIVHQDSSLIRVDGDPSWKRILGVILVVLAAIVTAVLFVVTAGAAIGAAAALVGAGSFSVVVTSGTLLTGAIVGTCVGITAGTAWFKDDIYLPAFTLSPEEIFSNTFPLFDINFFNPMEDKAFEVPGIKEEVIYEKCVIYLVKPDETQDNFIFDGREGAGVEVLYEEEKEKVTNGNYKYRDIYNAALWGYKDVPRPFYDFWIDLEENSEHSKREENKKTINNLLDIVDEKLAEREINKIDREKDHITQQTIWQQENGKTYHTVWYTIPELVENEDEFEATWVQIFFIQTTEEETQIIEVLQHSTAETLSKAVSTWYTILRNLALIVLMLILIYSGIRIVLASTAGEKAKYKERIVDWLVAICLVMIMHYIMVFAITLVNKVTDMIVGDKQNSNSAYIPLTTNQWNSAQDQPETWEKFGGQDNVFMDDPNAESGKALVWQTNLIGLYRIQAQFENEGTAKWIAYCFCYIVLVLYTIFFTFTYIKRIVYMAFLTIIAPLVAMTYPIDKITDGKAQAFESWLKEYIFNLMIQPLHLLLYTILVTFAFQLASEQPLYALVAIGFMMPAEKILRSFFGFEKAKTPGALGGAAGAALAMTGLQKIFGKSSGGSGGSGKGNENSTEQNNVKVAKRNGVNVLDAISGKTTAQAQNNNYQVNEAEKNNLPGEMNLPGINLTQNEVDQYNKDDEINLDDKIDVNKEGQLGKLDLKNKTPEEIEKILRQAKARKNAQGKAAKGVEKTNSSGPIFTSGNSSRPGMTRQTDQKGNKEKRKPSIWRAVGAVTANGGKQLAVGALRGIHPMKLAGKAFAGATVGTAGLLLGITSGDANKAFQYTTTGVALGTSLANNLSKNKILDLDELKEEAEMAYYGDEYKEKVSEREKEKFQNKEANIQYIRKTLGESEKGAKEILETTGARCFNNGITNIEDVVTIHKLTSEPGEDGKTMSFEYAVAARDYAKKRLPSNPESMTGKKIKEHKVRWANEFKERYGEQITEEEANEFAEKSYKAAIRFNKTMSGLTKL